MSFPATASQTVGPYFKIGLSYLDADSLCTAAAPGTHITVSGQVFDGEGVPVPDAQLELWQADDQGRFSGYDPAERGEVSPGFGGFARVPVDQHGAFFFRTVMPGSVPTLDGAAQAPHIAVVLSMRGLLKHLYTRIYFGGSPLNDTDPILQTIPADRRATLLATATGDTPSQYRINIRLQGENETVFFKY
jgi:protocatechuate 3,4-dioxygenase alpha subunit